MKDAKINNRNFPWIETIRFCRVRFFLKAAFSGRIHWFLGPEARGGMGRQIKVYMGCSGHNNEDCKKCPEQRKNNCLYAKHFVHDDNALKGFVLRLDPVFRGTASTFRAGDALQLDLILVGANMEMAYHWISALSQSPLRLGEGGGRFELIEAGFVNERGGFAPLNRCEDIPSLGVFPPVPPASAANRLELIFHTPAELTVTHGRYLYNPNELTFKLMVLRMLERTEAMARDHCKFSPAAGGRKEEAVSNLVDRANDVLPIENNARWKRVNIRKNAKRKTGGLVGSVVFEGEVMPYLDLIEASAFLGLGKQTTSGFGQMSYRIF